MNRELMKTKDVQKWLKKYGYYKGDIDGISGVLTINAIIEFQSDYFVRKNDIDGIYGINTDNLLRTVINVKENSKDFKPKEFKCRCGGRFCTGYPDYIRADTVKIMQKIRDMIGVTYISSGLRCPKYNSMMKASIPNSRHLTGHAIDFYSPKTTTLKNRKNIMDNIDNIYYSYCDGYYRYPKKNTHGKISCRAMYTSIHIQTI